MSYLLLNLTKPTTLSRDIGNLLLQSLMGQPDMPDHTQEKRHDQIAASMDTSNSF